MEVKLVITGFFYFSRPTQSMTKPGTELLFCNLKSTGKELNKGLHYISAEILFPPCACDKTVSPKANGERNQVPGSKYSTVFYWDQTRSVDLHLNILTFQNNISTLDYFEVQIRNNYNQSDFGELLRRWRTSRMLLIARAVSFPLIWLRASSPAINISVS